MILRSHIAAIALLLGAVRAPAMVTSSKDVVRVIPMYLGGTVVVENTAGDIDIAGTDDDKVVVKAVQNVRASDKAALAEGTAETQLAIVPDPRMVVIRTVVPVVHSGNWASGIDYTIRVPRTVHVKVVSAISAKQIHVAGIRGNVAVKSVTGQIVLDGLSGPSTIDTSNGTIIFNAPRGLADAQLSTVNGNIEVRAPADANFQWTGWTLKGDVRTSFPIRVVFEGMSFRGNVNMPGGPTISTRSLMGNIAVLKAGTQLASARSLRSLAPDEVVPSPSARAALPNTTQMFRRNVVQGFLEFSTLVGSIVVGEVRGNAKLATGAGEVQLGSVYGNCEVMSLGGPLNLGDIFGGLNATTQAGDVLVRSARNGGILSTGGGIIRLLYTGGPTRLQSGGGDIVVRQAAGPINAETQSGDISVTIDENSKTEKVTAKTAKGNIMLEVPPAFGADIDATLITSQPDVNKFVSPFSGLSLRREQIAGKTKIRATGKVNGGGSRVELYAQDGSIQITPHTGPAVTVIQP